MSRSWKKSEEIAEKCVRESLNYLEQTVKRNMDIENAVDEGSEGNVKCIIGN